MQVLRIHHALRAIPRLSSPTFSFPPHNHYLLFNNQFIIKRWCSVTSEPQQVIPSNINSNNDNNVQENEAVKEKPKRKSTKKTESTDEPKQTKVEEEDPTPEGRMKRAKKALAETFRYTSFTPGTISLE